MNRKTVAACFREVAVLLLICHPVLSFARCCALVNYNDCLQLCGVFDRRTRVGAKDVDKRACAMLK